MLKKAFQIVVTFGLLLGGYHTYLLGFAALTDRIGAAKTVDAAWVSTESVTAKEATRLAVEQFGKNHWAASPNLKIRVYDSERGFYMYARDYKRLEDGKKFDFRPFAIIWQSKDGKSRKIATSDRALIELNEKMGLIQPGQAALHVIEARLENNVVLRDDKGTLTERGDDLVVGPLPYIKYTEKTNPPEISSESDIRLVDRDLVVTGHDLLIRLRKTEGAGGSPAGFDAQTAFLKTNVDIVVKDVGKSGVLPGTAKGTPTNGPTPLHLKNEGEMRIDFPPKPRRLRPDDAGPPELEGPTYANFQRLVVVQRGVGILKDELTCDTLRLTLLPFEKPFMVDPRPGGAVLILGAGVMAPGAGGVSPRYGREDGPLTELAIREANAKGYSVWLTSVAQGMKARCDELIYKKLMPFAADETYLRGNLNRQIFVEKVDHEAPQPNPGPVTSVTSIWSADAKIFDDGKGGSASTVVARGPGRIETRPAADKPAEHAASWKTELVMRTIPLVSNSPALGGEPGPVPTKRLMTLTGDPKLEDFAKAMKLEAKQWVIVSLLPRPKLKTGESVFATPSPPQGGALASGSYQIEWVHARENVRLTSPGKTMVARDELNAPFEQVAALASDSSTPVTEEPTLLAESTPVPPPGGEPTPSSFGSKAEEPAPKPAEPNVIVTAHKIWAKIRQAQGKSELAEARLRGDVKFHQDAAPDKKRGTDVAGEALDIESSGNGKMKFRVFDTDPSALGSRARLAAMPTPKPSEPTMARIDTEDYTIIGPAIGMDQTIDYAWVNGPGRLTQLAERGFLNDKGVQEQIKAQAKRTVAREKEQADTKVPFTISWKEQMEFFGNSTDPKGRPSGKAQFRGGVDAVMEDSRVAADEIDTYTNRRVSLSSSMKPKSAGKTRAVRADTPRVDDGLPVAVNREDRPEAESADEPKPELAQLDARNSSKHRKKDLDVIVINVKRDPETGERIEVQRIIGEQVAYDKRTGDFSVPGKGMVYLWRRSALEDDKPSASPGDSPAQANRGRALPIVNSTRNGRKASGKSKEFGPWELTQVRFEDNMLGRFGVGKDKDETEARTADFYGAVQVLNARVADEVRLRAFSFDDHPKDFKRITADSLRIVSFPPPPGVKDAAARTLVTAENNAQATDETHTVAADILTFDSTKDLFYAYGLNGRDVSIVNQTNPGQPFSNVRSKAAYYNHKTGAAQPIDPITIQWLEASSGGRPGVDTPAGPAAPKPRNQRPPLRPPASNHIERRGFGSTK